MGPRQMGPGQMGHRQMGPRQMGPGTNGLQVFLNQRNSTNLRTDLHCIIAFAFVPVNDIKTTFDDLVDKIESKLLWLTSTNTMFKEKM